MNIVAVKNGIKNLLDALANIFNWYKIYILFFKEENVIVFPQNFCHQHDFRMAHKIDQTKILTSNFKQACHKNVKFRNQRLTTIF